MWMKDDMPSSFSLGENDERMLVVTPESISNICGFVSRPLKALEVLKIETFSKGHTGLHKSPQFLS